MEYVFAIIVGLILLVLQVFTFYFLINGLKRLIVCSEEIIAKVDSVTEDEDRYKDSKTGKTEYRYSYKVTFKYDYNGQTYEAVNTYHDHCSFSKGDNAALKINPHKPKEYWIKDEFKDIIALFLSVPLYAFFDILYISCVFN